MTEPTPTAPLTEAERSAFIERLRQSGIRIDREGELWHEGAVFEHQGLRQALFRWLDRLPDGRYVFRLDEQRFAYVDVADTPLVVRALRWRGDEAWLALSDGAEERLDPATLRVDATGVLYCNARGGRLEARLSNSASAALADRLTPEDPPRLLVRGHPQPIAPR